MSRSLISCLNVALGALVFAMTISSANAATIVYVGTLSGANEAPPNASAAIGSATVTIDTAAQTMRVQATFSGLSGNTTAAHIHCCVATPLTGTAGVATTTPSFVGFPLNMTSGSMDQTYDMILASSFNAAFITANGGTTSSAWAALNTGIDTQRAYFNIHTSAFGAGEIRTFFTPNTLNVDASSAAPKYLATTDGLLTIRYLLGLTGSALTSGALGSTATRTNSADVLSHLVGLRPQLDIDGDGNWFAHTDGVLMLRYMLGLRGDALIANAFTPGAPRSTAALIEAQLGTLMP